MNKPAAARPARVPRVLATFLVLIPAMTIMGGAAFATGDPNAGWVLARKWCRGCHVVDTSAEGTDTAPSFPSIAQDHGADPRWLRAWLVAPHPQMPDLNLSRTEIDDIVAYLSSLEKR